jgi:hypothetical protein
MSKTLAANTRILQSHTTGVQRYLLELLARMPELQRIAPARALAACVATPGSSCACLVNAMESCCARDGVDGYLVPPQDVSVLVKPMEELKLSLTLRKTMGLNAVTRTGEFTWVSYRAAVARWLSCWMSASR